MGDNVSNYCNSESLVYMMRADRVSLPINLAQQSPNNPGLRFHRFESRILLDLISRFLGSFVYVDTLSATWLCSFSMFVVVAKLDSQKWSEWKVDGVGPRLLTGPLPTDTRNPFWRFLDSRLSVKASLKCPLVLRSGNLIQ